MQILIFDSSSDLKTIETPTFPALKKGSKVPAAISEITKKHEEILDRYEEFPNIYQKEYFYLNGKKIMFYMMRKYFIKKPPKSYIDTIIEGYKNCNIDLNYTKKF